MRGREVGYGQRQGGGGRGWEPAEVVVGGRGQVLFGETHWTAAVAGDVTGDKQHMILHHKTDNAVVRGTQAGY